MPVERKGRWSARALGTVLVAGVLFAAAPARAQAVPPAGHEDEAFDFMNFLAQHDLHDIDHESWNVYGQVTYISSWHPKFPAAYTNANGSIYSLVSNAERSYTGSATLFFGVRLWPGAEAYFVPEAIEEVPFSQLHGIGGAIQNGELQKQGSAVPQLYRARTYLRQTIGLGGDHVQKTSDPMQLATVVDARRVVLTAGNFTILDVFDRNSVSGDYRQNLINMAFMTYSSWDFPSDARGYSWGGTAELYWDDWAFRIGRITPPKNPNDLPIDFRLLKFYGDELEVEHDHKVLGLPGAVRLLGYRNHVETGRFADAIAAFEADPAKNATTCTGFNYGSGNVTAPNLCWARNPNKPNNKVGVGLDVEQHIMAEVGVFARAMYSDGQTEVDAFNPANRSLAYGLIAKGSAWHRPFDVAGVGSGLSWISHVHAQYLAMGGIDGFIGDGHLRQAAEGIFEVFYSVNLVKALWLTADYQYLWNPGFNADRGPVNIFGARAHAEF